MARPLYVLVGARADVICLYFGLRIDGHWGELHFCSKPLKRQECPERRTEKSAYQAIQNPQKQIVSRHSQVPLDYIGLIARLLGGAISTGAYVSKPFGALMIVFSASMYRDPREIGSSNW
jgi:hypothetical protein